MIGRRRLLISAPALALPAACAAGAAAQCRLRPAAAVRLRAIEGFAVLDASVGGRPVSLLLDTGAEADLILPEAADALGLRRLPGTVPVIGTGGASQAPLVLLDGLRLGAVMLDPAPAPVAPLPAVPAVSPPVIGLLGAPLLDRYDLDMDAPAGHLALYPAAGCGNGAPALAPLQTTIALTVTTDRQALLPVRLNGTPLTALLDTGSRATLLAESAAARLGLSAPVSANTARGVDGAGLPVGHGRARDLQIGDLVRHDVPISIAPLQLGPADLLLGFDVLRLQRVWISYVSSRLVLALPSPAASAQ